MGFMQGCTLTGPNILAVAVPGNYTTPSLTVHSPSQKKHIASYPAQYNIRLTMFDPSSSLVFGILSGAVGLGVWDIKNGKPYLPEVINEKFRDMISLATDGTFLYTGIYYGVLKIFDLKDGKEVLSWHLYPEKKKYIETDISALCLYPGERILYTGGTDGQVIEMQIQE